MTTETTKKSQYIDTFNNERPKDGIDYSQARLASALKLNDELADYFRDRAQIEDTYAKSIAKLSKKSYISNKSSMGTFLPLWEALQTELSRSAAIHSEYSASIIENIEHPLRTSIPSNKDYGEIQRMDEYIHRVAREIVDLETKIQKYKKSAKGDKAAEYVKQKEQKMGEWNQHGPQYLQKHELVDESRLNTIKFVVDVFEALQTAQANKIIEMTGNTVKASENLQVDEEIAAFCSAYSSHQHQQQEQQQQRSIRESPSMPQLQSQNSELLNLDTVIPEPSLSNASYRSNNKQSHGNTPESITTPAKKEKKRFFSSLVSIRRKPKSDTHHELGSAADQMGRQRSFSNADSFVDSASFHSVNTHSTADQQGNEHVLAKSASSHNFGADLVIPVSPSSANTPSLRKAPSFNGSTTSQPAPLIHVDSEGFSIPPPDRTAWPLEGANTTNESLVETDDMGSDGGSLFSNSNPRIRVDIKNESVSEEDASQSAVALTRVATLLKEKNSITPPPSRRLRGRREMRATQLYSVIEQDQILSQVENQQPSSPFANPFELSQERIVEEPETNNFSEKLPQIDVHITETVHVISRGGEAEKSIIWGDISIKYNGPSESATPICFQLDHASKFDKLEPTEHVTLMNNYELDTFKINTQLLSSGESVVCIRYQVPLSGLPIVVKPMWKCDTDKSRLLVKYHKQGDLPPLEKVMLFTTVTGNVQNALSIPAGELVLSQKKIKWDIGQLDDSSEHLIKAQFTTLEQASPQPIVVRFELSNTLMSDTNVNHGADSLVLWAKVVSTTKHVKVGKYIAEV